VAGPALLNFEQKRDEERERTRGGGGAHTHTHTMPSTHTNEHKHTGTYTGRLIGLKNGEVAFTVDYYPAASKGPLATAQGRYSTQQQEPGNATALPRTQKAQPDYQVIAVNYGSL
jgi:hypothetical protein